MNKLHQNNLPKTCCVKKDSTKAQNWRKKSLKHKDIAQHRFLEVGDNLYLLFSVFSTGNNFRQWCSFVRESSGFPRTARRHTQTRGPNKGTKLEKKLSETQGYCSTSLPRGRRQSLLAVWRFLY